MTLEQCVEKFLRTVQENPGLRVADVAMYDGEWYEDQEELIEAYYNKHDEEYEGWDGVKVDYDIIERTKHLWHKVILVNVDLPDSTCKWGDEA